MNNQRPLEAPGKIDRSDLADQELVQKSSKMLKEIADLFAPRGREHVGSVCLHFYAGTNLMTAKNEIDLMTQKVNMNMSQEAITLMMPEIRDRIFEAFGAQRSKLGPKTVEETRDSGEQVIKTSLDS